MSDERGPRWTKFDREKVKLAIYGFKMALPVAGSEWDRYVDDNARELVLRDCQATAERHAQWHADALANLLPSVRADLERVRLKAPGSAAVSTAVDRLRWHEKQADKSARSARRYRALAAKIERFGLPPKESTEKG